MESAWSEKHKKRKKTDYDMKAKEKNPSPGMTGYQPSEKQRRKGKIPAEQVLVESQDGFLSAGFLDKTRLVVTVSKDQGDSQKKSEELLKNEDAKRHRIDGKNVWVNRGEEQKSAVSMEFKQSVSKSRLLKAASGFAEKLENETMPSILPYLAIREEKEQVKALEEEARQNSHHRELVEERRGQAAEIRQRLLKKEQEQRRLLKALETGLSEEKAWKEKKAFWEISFFEGKLSEGPGDAEEALEEDAEEAADEDLKEDSQKKVEKNKKK